jgi:flagellar hook-basal body complex protein FliE
MQRFVIQADLVGSRKISERAKFAQTLKAALKELNRKYGSALQAALEITKGIDELSAVIRDPAVAPSMILDLAIRIHPHAFRVVLVHGEVDIVSPSASLSDGPAFHLSSGLILEIEKSALLFGFDSRHESTDPVFGLLMHHCLSMISAWPSKTAMIAGMKRQAPDSTLQQMGSQLGISHQAVSAALKRSRLDEIELAESLFISWLSRHFPKHLFTGSD